MAYLASQSSIAQIYRSLSLPASSRCIRVLKIEAISPDQANSGILQASLRVLDLASTPAPDFTALSYVWGDIKGAASTSIINVGAGRVPMQLTDNCYEALTTLRATVESLTIWVDAICINQADGIEKMHQISLMKDIYTKADATYVWLGKGDDATARAMICLSTVGMLNYYFSTPQQFPGAPVNPAPFLAAFTLYARRFSHMRHALRLPFDRLGSRCHACKREGRNAFMASSGKTDLPVVSVNDVAQLLDNGWVYRLWTYQEIMLSENPVLVCGRVTIPWWRFAMSIMYLRITEDWTDIHDIHQGESTDRLFKSLRHWRALVLDRNSLQMSKRRALTSTSIKMDMAVPSTGLDLEQYSKFLGIIANIFMADEVHRTFFETITGTLQCGVPLGWAYNYLRGGQIRGRPVYVLVVIALLTAASILHSVIYLLGRHLDHTVRRPRRRFILHDPVLWPEESLAENVLLSALWARQCKEPKDFNFGIRGLLQILTKEHMPRLDYSSSLEEVYRDLTVNLLRYTNSSELLLAALRSNLLSAPSWTVDWSMRTPLRLAKRSYESKHGLFYDMTKRPLPRDSWRFDPLQPNVLQVRAWMLGTVKAVLDFKALEENSGPGQHDRHIHNLEALLTLANAELDENDWGGVQSFLHELTGSTLKFLRKNRHSTPEEVFNLLQASAQVKSVHSSVMERCKVFSKSAGLFESYKRFCNTMAMQRDRRIVVIDGARPVDSNISTSQWPSNVSMAKCHPISNISGSATTSAASGGNLMTQFQDCRVQSGDAVLQLCGLREKAVVRQVGNKLLFVDAVEAMGLPGIIDGWTNSCNASQMPLVNIS